MNQFRALLKMARPVNLLILGLTMWIVYFQLRASSFQNTLEGAMAILASLLVCTAGYYINDYFDLESDLLNKPDKIQIGKGVSRPLVFRLAVGLALLGAAVGIWIGFGQGWVAWVPLLSAALVFAYSAYFQHTFLLGNLLVGLLTALSLIYPAGFAGWLDTAGFGDDLPQFLLLTFTLFAFVATVGREIAKDAEDAPGDRRVGGKTLAIKAGASVKWAILFVLSLHLVPVLMIANSRLSDRLLSTSKPLLALNLILLAATFLNLLRKSISAREIQDYASISLWFKLLMFLGIIVFYQLAVQLNH